jgi:hemoglobin-like flavoprotein
LRKLDLIDGLAILLMAIGITLFFYGLSLNPPGSLDDLVEIHFGDWTPGFIIDGVLLIIINRVIHANERRRIISQVASLSNEFALDAVRRCRDEGWLRSGAMKFKNYDNARLSSADLSSAQLHRASFRFSDMSTADLTHADLSGADLTGTNFSDADLRWANLSNACLRWTDLRGAQLDGANLEGAESAYASVDRDLAETRNLDKAIVGGFLTDRQRKLIETSFRKFCERGDSASSRFYENLFRNAPAVRPMFPEDVSKQARKFMQSLNVIVGSLSSTDRTTRMLQRLGDRHRGYGVEPSHYPVVGQALISTLKQELGNEFTEEVEKAWIDAFELISSAMMSISSTSDTAK